MSLTDLMTLLKRKTRLIALLMIKTPALLLILLLLLITIIIMIISTIIIIRCGQYLCSAPPMSGLCQLQCSAFGPSLSCPHRSGSFHKCWSVQMSTGPAECVCWLEKTTLWDVFLRKWCRIKRTSGIPTTVIHAVKSDNVNSTEVQPLSNDLIKVRDSGGDGRDALILVEGQGSVVHDGLIIIRRVEISDEVILILIEIMFLAWVKTVILLFQGLRIVI